MTKDDDTCNQQCPYSPTHRIGSNVQQDRSSIRTSTTYQYSHDDLIHYIIEQDWNTTNHILDSNAFKERHDREAQHHEGQQSNHLPIHLISAMPSAPLQTVQRILNVYGYDTCLIEDEDGNLPIHVACSTPGVKHEVIELLFRACPHTSKYRCRSGVYPLSCICGHRCSCWKVIK